MRLSRTLSSLGILTTALLGLGCDKGDQDIKIYRLAKPDAETAATDKSATIMSAPATGQTGMPGMPGSDMSGVGMPAQMPGGAGAEAGPKVTDTPPADWKAQPPSSMRLASYQIKGVNGALADVSLITLAGVAGGLLENVNRWLSQLGKQAVTEEDLKKTATHVTTPLGDATVVDLEGLPSGADPSKDGRIIGAIISGADSTYFFKLRGNAALAAAQKAKFLQWITTVRLGDTAAGGTAK